MTGHAGIWYTMDMIKEGCSMRDSTLFPILLQVFLILCNAVFACAEIAVISMNDNRMAMLAAQGDRRALRLVRLTSRPARFLAVIQIGITLSGFLGSAFAADHFSDRLASALVTAGVPLSRDTLDTCSVVGLTLLLSYLTLVFGELVPKRLAMKKAESLAMALSGLISAISVLFAPLAAFLTASTNGVLRLLRVDPNAEEETVSEEELRMMLARGTEKGVFDRETTRFIENVFAFDDRAVGEFVRHRTELAILWKDQTLEEWRDTILSTRHTRYPVCEETVDQVTGILDARDFFRLDGRTKEDLLAGAVTPAFFVPETVKANVLFRQMKQRKTYYSVVLDEHGGFLGIVTLRDLLEQLVGQIGEDELPPVQQLAEGTWRVQGTATLDEVAEAVGVPLPAEEYETFSGYALGLYGSIPRDGQQVTIQTDRLWINLTDIRHHRVEEAVVRLERRQEHEEDGGA